MKTKWRCEPGKEPDVFWLIADPGHGREYGLAFSMRTYKGLVVPTFLIASMVTRIERAIHNDS